MPEALGFPGLTREGAGGALSADSRVRASACGIGDNTS